MEKDRLKRKASIGTAAVLMTICILTGCAVSGGGKDVSGQNAAQSADPGQKNTGEMQQTAQVDTHTAQGTMIHSGEAEPVLKLYVNEEELSVVWENNESVDALAQLAKEDAVIIDLSMYGGFEQVGSIGQTLPRNDEQITTSAGDIVLYSGDRIVVFYGSNTWAYTRLGKITGRTDAELAQLLGSGDAKMRIELVR